MFKQWIFFGTAGAVLIILTAVPWGRYLTSAIIAVAERTTRIVPPHQRHIATEDYWRDHRRRGIELTRPRVDRFYADSSPAKRRLLHYAGMDPEHGLLRWGNVTWTILLSSKVFEADDTGRSFRLRPHTRAIWLLDEPGVLAVPVFYLVPDGPGLAQAIAGTPTTPIETSRQTANSWGLRGPEPDLAAPLRVLVLGDSYMQGMFIGDDETPPECLRRDLQNRLKTTVSVLNTGLMGYSPEQYYYTLLAFAERFDPHAVVISFFANDFGNVLEVTAEGKGDFREGKHWLEKIVELCKERHWAHLTVAVPFKGNVVGRRRAGRYPGQILNVLNIRSLNFLDPVDEFVSALLEEEVAATERGGALAQRSLFNDAFGDDEHFSAFGSEVWAKAVGRRLVLLLKRQRSAADQPGAQPPQSATAR